MLFNSIEFVIFLPITFFLYWFVAKKNTRYQNLLILASSYVFYGWWDWRFLSLIIVSSTVDYCVGMGLLKEDSPSRRKLLLAASIGVNLGLLGFFKYYNFFAESFAAAFTLFGKNISVDRLNILLPVGISFYTFQTLSYSIDTYKKKITPTTDIIAFFAFVTFFPQLVAGPIERATNLLPQFFNKRKFDYDKAVDGMRQILWGLFKKIVIADNCANFVNEIFANYSDYSGSILLTGAFYFSIQIYCDFSGYSDIAIGTARLFGFDLMRNFNFPYFSRDIAEFWRRWHISLSTWFRDYVYILLGGSRSTVYKKIRNTFVIFIVSGFWHGANWTFVIWGFINACYFLPLLLLKQNRKNTDIVAEGKLLPSLKEACQIGLTFFLTLIAWIFFRAENLSHAFGYLYNMFQAPFLPIPAKQSNILSWIAIMLAIEWFQRDKQHALQFSSELFLSRKCRWAVYVLLVFSIYYLGRFNNFAFIYFQF